MDAGATQSDAGATWEQRRQTLDTIIVMFNKLKGGVSFGGVRCVFPNDFRMNDGTNKRSTYDVRRLNVWATSLVRHQLTKACVVNHEIVLRGKKWEIKQVRTNCVDLNLKLYFSWLLTNQIGFSRTVCTRLVNR